VISARLLGAEQIILLGRHPARIALAKDFGATDIVSERGEAAVERVRELTGGLGAHSVLECVGLEQAVTTALEIARPGGAVARVGVPQHDELPGGVPFWKNVSVGGGPAPVRARTSRSSSDTFSTEASSRAASSTALPGSTACRTATGR
jgi:threonine dehydrogenase-like Zn-dependent dehydrogenase